jgi:hypothetical protein
LAPALLALLSSYAFDYVARQKVGGINMTYGYVQQIAAPPPATFTGSAPWGRESWQNWIAMRCVELVATSTDMVGFAEDAGLPGPFRWDVHRRELLRAELDAAFFHVYGMTADDVDHVMEAFPIVKRKDIAEHGSYRTKDLILDIYDHMTKAIESGEPYETILDPPPADRSLCHPAVDAVP